MSIAVRSPRIVSMHCRPVDEEAFQEWFRWASRYVPLGADDVTATGLHIPEDFSLSLRAEPSRQEKDARTSLATAEWYITRHWAARLAKEFLVCHAGVLTHRDQACLLAGASGAGKSTLTLGLVNRGFRYLSDEFAMVCPNTLQVLPFPNALCMKNLEVLPPHQISRHFDVIPYPADFGQRDGKFSCCLPHREIVPLPGERFPVRWVFLLRDEKAPSRPSLAARWKAASTLYGLSMRTGEDVFHTAAGIVRGARVWEMGRSNLEAMADCIEDILLSGE